MTPSLRTAQALRMRTLPDLDDPEALLGFAADVLRDADALAALCDRPELARAVVALVEPADLLRRRVRELEQQLAIAQGMAATFERQLLAERDAHQATTLELEAATAGAPRTRLQRQRCHTVRLPIEQRRDGEDYELTTTDEAPDTDVVDETEYTRGPVTVRLEGDAR